MEGVGRGGGGGGGPVSTQGPSTMSLQRFTSVEVFASLGDSRLKTLKRARGRREDEDDGGWRGEEGGQRRKRRTLRS
eukprot:7025085-Pyramimonas_sp.AAC.1